MTKEVVIFGNRKILSQEESIKKNMKYVLFFNLGSKGKVLISMITSLMILIYCREIFFFRSSDVVAVHFDWGYSTVAPTRGKVNFFSSINEYYIAVCSVGPCREY